jgi:hypothetical protein
MSTQYKCDVCSNYMSDPGRTTLSMAVSTPHATAGLPKFDKDLCPRCFEVLLRTLRLALDRYLP